MEVDTITQSELLIKSCFLLSTALILKRELSPEDLNNVNHSRQ